MACQRCGSHRVLECNSHASDCQNFVMNGAEHAGYAPEIVGVCSGDDLFPDICLDCGQTQGKFPKPLVEELES